MKQIIVLISSIVLGLAIATFVMGFEDDAKKLSDKAQDKIDVIAEKIVLPPENAGGSGGN